jgi:predicted permease
LSSGGHGSLNSSTRIRRVLIVAQVALAMSLLCAMGLLLRSWHGLLSEDLGFEPQNLLVARIDAPGSPDHPLADADPLVVAALDELRGIPGVREIAHTNVAPFAGSESVNTMPVPGQDDQRTTARTRNVSEHYFRTTGIPLLRGRSFEKGDADGAGIIVDEYFASLYFPAGGAVGERIRMFAGPDGFRDAVIVGVARTAKYRAPDEQPDQGTVYRFSPTPLPNVTLVIATEVPPATLMNEVQNTLERVVGPDRTGNVAAMENLVRRTVRDREPQLILLGLFGMETLALSGIGLFSLLAYSVHARAAEFAVRQAVGAKSADIRRHVLADAVRLLVPGLAFGIAGAWLAGRLVASRLYQVSPADPVTWTATGLLLALVVLAAGFWPAMRASRIQPTEALRYE